MSQQNPTNQSEHDDPPEDCPIAAAIERECCGNCLHGPDICALYVRRNGTDADGLVEWWCGSADD